MHHLIHFRFSHYNEKARWALDRAGVPYRDTAVLPLLQVPVVIAAMGQNGSKPATGAMLTIQKAQLAMNDVPEFKGNVKAIRTDLLVDKAAEELYPMWRERFEEWKLTGGDHGYHYLGSAIWFTRIGHAMGDAMVELLDAKQAE